MWTICAPLDDVTHPVAFEGSTRSPMASLRTNSPSPARLKTRSTPWKSSTRPTKPGAVSSTVIPPLVKFPCRSPQALSFICTHPAFSRNLTNANSPGFTHRNDPAYLSIPPASNLPPAPIDPSSTFKSDPTSRLYTDHAFSLQVVPYLFRYHLNTFFSYAVLHRTLNKENLAFDEL